MHLAESAVLRCNRCCLWLFYGLRIISHGLYCRCWVLCHMSSSLSIPNVYLTPHASRCDETDRPAQSWCSVHELDACTHVHQCVGMFPLKIALCQNNMTLREFKQSDPPWDEINLIERPYMHLYKCSGIHIWTIFSNETHQSCIKIIHGSFSR